MKAFDFLTPERVDYVTSEAQRELDMLLINATEAERQKLFDAIDMGQLNGEEASSCIYGTMTGSCYNRRASNLIKSCANTSFAFAWLSSAIERTIGIQIPGRGMARCSRGFTALEWLLVNNSDAVRCMILDYVPD